MTETATVVAIMLILLLVVCARLVPALRWRLDVWRCRHAISRPKQLESGRIALVCYLCGAHTPGSEPLSPDPRRRTGFASARLGHELSPLSPDPRLSAATR